jgi:hypothetical protein
MGRIMERELENCLHLEGLRVAGGSEFRCPVCEERLDLAGVERWVRVAERERDIAYSEDEGDEFGEIVREERQREVYRRRRALYELRSAPRVVVERPEMLLISHDAAGGSYDCRVFYKEPRPVPGLERLVVEAVLDRILALHSDPNPIARLVAGKLEEFHALRKKLTEGGDVPPSRRVFYAAEF